MDVNLTNNITYANYSVNVTNTGFGDYIPGPYALLSAAFNINAQIAPTYVPALQSGDSVIVFLGVEHYGNYTNQTVMGVMRVDSTDVVNESNENNNRKKFLMNY